MTYSDAEISLRAHAIGEERRRLAYLLVNHPPDRHALTSAEIDKAAVAMGLVDEVAEEWAKAEQLTESEAP